MLSFAQALFTDRSAATAIEYAFIAALIALAIAGTVATLGEDLVPIFEEVSAAL